VALNAVVAECKRAFPSLVVSADVVQARCRSGGWGGGGGRGGGVMAATPP
jgi:hypothetical protein